MLKTLEEPPEYLKFVLATTDPQKVPVTVLSRCLQFNLRPMAPQTVSEHLAACWRRSSRRPTRPALRLLAAGAPRGSMRDALSLTDQAIAFGGGRWTRPGAPDAGQRRPRHVFRLIEALAAGDGAARGVGVDGLRDLGLNAASHAGGDGRGAAAPGGAAGGARCGSIPAIRMAGGRAPRRAAAPTRRSCSTASCCTAGRTGLAPDEYAGLTMVLLRPAGLPPGGKKLNDAGRETKTGRCPKAPAAAPHRQCRPRPGGPGPAPALRADASRRRPRRRRRRHRPHRGGFARARQAPMPDAPDDETELAEPCRFAAPPRVPAAATDARRTVAAGASPTPPWRRPLAPHGAAPVEAIDRRWCASWRCSRSCVATTTNGCCGRARDAQRSAANVEKLAAANRAQGAGHRGAPAAGGGRGRHADRIPGAPRCRRARAPAIFEPRPSRSSPTTRWSAPRAHTRPRASCPASNRVEIRHSPTTKHFPC